MTILFLERQFCKRLQRVWQGQVASGKFRAPAPQVNHHIGCILNQSAAAGLHARHLHGLVASHGEYGVKKLNEKFSRDKK
jgi:hypothetical protein